MHKLTPFIFLFLLGSNSFAQFEFNSRFVDGVNVVIDSDPKFIAERPWSDDVKEELTGGRVAKSDKFFAAVEETPMISWLRYPTDNAQKFKKMGSIIASQCKAKNSSDVMAAISCVAHSVHGTLMQTGWPNFYSFCRSHEAAFRSAFNALNVPESSVSGIDSSTEAGGHVVNRFILKSKNLGYFTYVIDAGNKPSNLFPVNDNAVRWHQLHKSEFPEFSFDRIPTSFKPASKSAEVSK